MNGARPSWLRLVPPDIPSGDKLVELRDWSESLVSTKEDGPGGYRPDDWKDKQSKVDSEFFGVICEVTIATLFDVEANLRIYGKYQGDGGFDLNLGPCLAGVKGTRIRGNSEVPPTCGLILRPSEKCADVMILCYIGKFLTYVDVAGWVSQRRWDEQHVVKDLGYGPRHFMEQENLSDIRELLRHVESRRR